ncbi:hypothetical protein [Halosimplex amylolyticum]|uniref:hypothetical protein n=1 Tax=Halosimplex amylolyticum TaxID=3396616 RepID=UPI003F54F89C
MTERKSAHWMEQIDERILEYMDSEGWASPTILAQERGISASRGRIRDRFKTLQYAGLVVPIGDDMYDLTGDGILFLRGDIDARYRPKPTASKVFQDRYPCPGRWPQARMSDPWL